jgi:photosystem II stability/assembly factor-like uncharacterized protein
VALLLALGVVSLLPRAAASPSALGSLPVYERYVAIDGACAWPRLTLLPTGEISALIWPYPNHGFVQGAAEVWNSADAGRTWQRVGVPVPNDPGFNRMNSAAGLADDGTYVVLMSGWPRPYLPPWTGTLDDESKLGEKFKDARVLQSVPAVSHDGGHTWVRYPALTEPLEPSGNALVPHGRIGSLPGGELGVMMYYSDAWFFTSADHGKTWRRRAPVTTDHAHNETTWIRLENGDLFAASRGEKNSCLDGYRSTDGGATWVPEGPLTLNGQHPADLTRLPDGRIVLSYGVRNPGLWGVAVRFGDATARNWSAPLVLVDFEDSSDHPRLADPRRDGGYPSTVATADGTLVTAYYTRGIPAHHRYHMGVVRWRPPEAERK